MIIYNTIKNTKSNMIQLPHHRIHFSPIDPLGDGLGDDIAAERSEPEAITDLSDPINASDLATSWGALLEEVKQDPEWFTFADE